jgi:hypothetical protein
MSSRVGRAGRWLAGTAACGVLGLGTPVLAQPPELPAVVAAPGGVPAAAPGAAARAAPSGEAIAPKTPLPEVPAAPACPPARAADRDDVSRKVPPVQPLPRPGFFPMLPTGPGYYSLLDALTGNYRDGPPKYPYPRVAAMTNSFFDADFRYLDDPTNAETDFFDPLKRVRVGDNWLFSTGGEVRNRIMSEYNSRLTQADNNYDLTRVRVYGDLWFRDDFRIYAEFIGAYTIWQDLPPLPIDENRADFLNLFIDAKLFELDGKPVYARIGRQELLFASQRLISPLDWANTRRTFQGVRVFRRSEDLDVDAFWVRPVAPNPGRLDSWDDKQDFAGLWTTIRPAKGQAVDLYYLYLDNRNAVTQLGVLRAPTTANTFGGRYVGDKDGSYLWDFEGVMQLGSQGPANLIAGMATAGLGYHLKDVAMNPTFWAYYDFASGDNAPNVGSAHTFNQLFPFGHYYFGWLDLVGRQNIHDFNLHTYLYPTNWVQFDLQYHDFWLADARDALYNAAGNAIRRDPTGRSGTHVGQEVDAIVNFHLTKHSDILTGYSYLWGGEFLRRTAGPTAAANASLAYVQFDYRW